MAVGGELHSSPLYEQSRERRTHGLIAEDKKEFFMIYPPEEQESSLFDWLCDATSGGYVGFRDKKVRVEHFIENGSEVRGIIVPLSKNADGTENVRAVCLITCSDGRTCLESHDAVELQGRVISEPEVGSPGVMPGTHQDLLLHYAVAYEGVPLPIAS